MLLFISLWEIPVLCPMGADLGVKPSAASCSPTLPLYLGLPTEQAENQGTLPGRGCLSLGRNSNSPNCTWDYLEKYMEAFTGLTLLYDLTWKDVIYVLGQTWLLTQNLSLRGSYFWRWMAWMWNKGKEGTPNSPPSYRGPSSSHNRATLLYVSLKDSSERTLRL